MPEMIDGGDWAKDRIIPDGIRAIETGLSIAIRKSMVACVRTTKQLYAISAKDVGKADEILRRL